MAWTKTENVRPEDYAVVIGFWPGADVPVSTALFIKGTWFDPNTWDQWCEPTHWCNTPKPPEGE